MHEKSGWMWSYFGEQIPLVQSREQGELCSLPHQFVRSIVMSLYPSVEDSYDFRAGNPNWHTISLLISLLFHSQKPIVLWYKNIHNHHFSEIRIVNDFSHGKVLPSCCYSSFTWCEMNWFQEEGKSKLPLGSKSLGWLVRACASESLLHYYMSRDSKALLFSWSLVCVRMHVCLRLTLNIFFM